MARPKISFAEAREHFEKHGWKLLITVQKGHYAIFIKPSAPNEPPRWLYLDDAKHIDKDEFDKIKP